MTTKRTRNKSKAANLRMQMFILQNRQTNLSVAVSEQLIRMSLIVKDLRSEIRKLKEDNSYDKERTG